MSSDQPYMYYHQVYEIFKNSYVTEFSADWLTDWLILMYAFRLVQLNNGYIYRLDNFTNQLCFIPRLAFLPTAAAPALASWFYQRLSLFSFVLRSFLFYCVGDDLWYTRYGFGATLGFFTWNVIQNLWSSWKRSTVIHRNRVKNPLF